MDHSQMALPLGLPVTQLNAPTPAATTIAYSPGSISGTTETTARTGFLSTRSIAESLSTSTIPNDIEDTERLYKAMSTRCKIKNTHDADFNSVLDQALEAIDNGVNPALIPSGSSGSYFVYDKFQRPIGVFKPKDEEPFAPLNPKWPKFFQRMLCFCCFGRACLIPNNGYLSETAASLVDERLQLYVVPKTRVVKLLSPAFNYGRGLFRGEQRPKEGSFQLFVHGYRPAGEVLAQWTASGPSALTPDEEAHFLVLFQKMCVLDYVIRNTDRHTDNWLIRHVPDEPIQVAVIDNGLAFPVKHPECASRFRHYPFHWAELSWAQKPLEREFRDALMELLTPDFVHNLANELRIFFRNDTSNNRLLIYNQMRVLRGQLWNLRDAIDADEPPSEWIKREPILATRKFRQTPPSSDFDECFRRRPADYSSRTCC